jgi:hypothetical protein
MKEAVGSVSVKLHTTLHNTTEIVKNILTDGETVDEKVGMDTNHNQDKNADAKRQPSESGGPVDTSGMYIYTYASSYFVLFVAVPQVRRRRNNVYKLQKVRHPNLLHLTPIHLRLVMTKYL